MHIKSENIDTNHHLNERFEITKFSKNRNGLLFDFNEVTNSAIRFRQ